MEYAALLPNQKSTHMVHELIEKHVHNIKFSRWNKIHSLGKYDPTNYCLKWDLKISCFLPLWKSLCTVILRLEKTSVALGWSSRPPGIPKKHPFLQELPAASKSLLLLLLVCVCVFGCNICFIPYLISFSRLAPHFIEEIHTSHEVSLLTLCNPVSSVEG